MEGLILKDEPFTFKTFEGGAKPKLISGLKNVNLEICFLENQWTPKLNQIGLILLVRVSHFIAYLPTCITLGV